MKPGATTRSLASMVLFALAETRPTSAMRPCAMATSARRAGAPVPSTICPSLMMRSYVIRSKNRGQSPNSFLCSLRLDLGHLHPAAPALGFRAQVRSHPFGRAGEGVERGAGEKRLGLLAGGDLVEPAGEAIDDRARRAGGHDDAEPGRDVELAQAELGERRHVGNGALALGGGDRED